VGRVVRFLSAQKRWSVAGTRIKRREVPPFITALKYFISLTCSKVGVCSLPNTLRISLRNRCRTCGLSASIAMANVRVDAVYETPLASGRWFGRYRSHRIPSGNHNINSLILNKLVICGSISLARRRQSRLDDIPLVCLTRCCNRVSSSSLSGDSFFSHFFCKAAEMIGSTNLPIIPILVSTLFSQNSMSGQKEL